MKHIWQRAARRLGWDHNPLRRGVDRAEAATMSALLAIFIIGGPVAGVVAGRIADTAGIREQQAQQSWKQRPATLLESAAEQAGSSGAWSTAWVRARWTMPDGRQRTGLVATDLNARDGQRIDVWVTGAGQLTRPPLTTADVRDQVMFAVLSATMGLGFMLAAAAGVSWKATSRSCQPGP